MAHSPRLKRLRRRPTGRDFIKRLRKRGGGVDCKRWSSRWAGGAVESNIIPERRYVLRR